MEAMLPGAAYILILGASFKNRMQWWWCNVRCCKAYRSINFDYHNNSAFHWIIPSWIHDKWTEGILKLKNFCHLNWKLLYRVIDINIYDVIEMNKRNFSTLSFSLKYRTQQQQQQQQQRKIGDAISTTMRESKHGSK